MKKLTLVVTILAAAAASTFLWRHQQQQELRSLPGRIETFVLDSPSLGVKKLVNVYVPGEYGRTGRRYPVVYLYRGHEREWTNPQEDAHRQGTTAATVADELIKSGAIPPAILVMPSTTSDDGSYHSIGVNLRYPEFTEGAAGVGSGRFADYLGIDVVDAVDQRYRTLADRAHRHADGFSLGGFTALSVALRHPDRFSSAGAFDGTFFYPGGQRPDGSPDSLASHTMFTAAFSHPPAWAWIEQYNPADLIAAATETTLKQIRFFLRSGPEALEPTGSNFYRTQQVVQLLEAKGVKNGYENQELPNSSHNWFWADEHLKQALIKHLN